LLLSTAWF